MPRILPSLFWRARRLSPLATLLLPVCRDVASALAELRWIREHVAARRDRFGPSSARASDAAREAAVLRLCRRRGRGEPLQYVLGTQPFGPLDLLCRRGVLIPRPEPEAYSMHLADLLLQEARGRPQTQTQAAAPLTVLDACTGTGCIALLLYARLRQAGLPSVQAVGVDVAPAAVRLARSNAVRNGLASSSTSAASVQFVQCDLFSDGWLADAAVQRLTDGLRRPLDVLVSNPPYVSVDGFAHETARSVRLFEPKLAQVPTAHRLDSDAPAHAPEDVFYVRLLQLAGRLDARIVLCEVGGRAQAERVVALALAGQATLPSVEIWADSPDAGPSVGSARIAGHDIPIRGRGHARSVLIRQR